MDNWPKTTKEEDEIAEKEALFIYGHLKKKYPNQDTRDLDIILNSLAFALLRLMRLNVQPEDYMNYIKLVVEIFKRNIT